MIAKPEQWIPLEPGFRRNSRAWQIFISLVVQLKAPACEKQSLDRVRSSLLELADQNGDDRQRLRVLVSILCDLRSKGWQFRIEDGAPAVAPPEDGGGSILEQKERVRASLLLERDVQLGTSAVRAFVQDMEQRRLTKHGWISVFSVMRDGRELAQKLREARADPD